MNVYKLLFYDLFVRFMHELVYHHLYVCVLYVQQYESYHPSSPRTVLLDADGHGSRTFVFRQLLWLSITCIRSFLQLGV
jgi:hypothetical protein